MSQGPYEFHVGDVVHYKPHHPSDVWDDELWWVVAKVTTQYWQRPVTVFYEVARVADPDACWRLDTAVRADMMLPAKTPPGFHLPA